MFKTTQNYFYNFWKFGSNWPFIKLIQLFFLWKIFLWLCAFKVSLCIFPCCLNQRINGGWVEAGHQRPRVAPGIVLQSLFGHSKGVFQTEIYVNVFGNILSWKIVLDVKIRAWKTYDSSQEPHEFLLNFPLF